jgi:tRNA pseudouridine13 synthase
MKILEAEKCVGIYTYFTAYKGLNGKLKQIPKDFEVEELSIYPTKNENGDYLIADVTSINWENNILIRDLSNRLHISRNRISFAGTKDKRAKTTRVLSFFKVSENQLSKIKLNNIEIKNIYSSNKPIQIGNLIGNKFNVNIRNIEKNIKKENVKLIIDKIITIGGFPNFFGIQRFGIIRPITHIVGKNIILGNYEKAVMTYIANPIKEEGKDIYDLRRKLEKTRDYSEALKSYPNNLNFEKSILNKLVINPYGFIESLKGLPKNLLTMFVYAYQSYIFNRILSERILKNIPINEAIVGDIIYPIRKGKIEENLIQVKENNLEKVNIQIKKNKAVITAMLFGSETVYSKGEMGEIEHKIIENEKINQKDFVVTDIPFISSRGSRRPIFAVIKDIKFLLKNDDLNKDKKLLNLQFQLKKGCYATSILREFMKAEDIKNY